MTATLEAGSESIKEFVGAADVASLAADADWAAADYKMRISQELGVTSGAPLYFVGRSEDGRQRTLYTREIYLPGRSGPVRRLIVATMGTDANGLFLDTNDWTIDTSTKEAAFDHYRHRTADGRVWDKPVTERPPIPVYDLNSKVLKINANHNYEDSLPTRMRPATTAVSALFRARTSGVSRFSGRRVSVEPHLYGLPSAA